MALILIVDDEPDLVRVLEYNLKQEGFDTLCTGSGEAALVFARTRRPDLILLDLMLPDLPGTEVCHQLREDPALQGLPVVMLTARSSELDRVVGLELGADDYITKPFSPREVVLRVRAVLRRGGREGEAQVAVLGLLKLDHAAHRCSVGSEEVPLTPLEYKLVTLLMQRAGRVQSRETLLQEVWGITSEVETRTVDTHVKRLREKLGAARDYVETVRGVGYRMKTAAELGSAGTGTR